MNQGGLMQALTGISAGIIGEEKFSYTRISSSIDDIKNVNILLTSKSG